MDIVFIRTGHFTCELSQMVPYFFASAHVTCRLGMSWCVQPQVNGIPSNIRFAIGSARSDICGATNSTWSDIFIESTLMRYGHSKGGLTGITLNDMAVALLAHSLHSRSPLVRNMTSVQNELSKDPSSGRIQCTDQG